jgi:predicted HTH transcriptional regulator
MKVALNMPTEGKSKSRSRLQEQGRISFMLELSDRDILSRLTDTEDSTVECKTSADYRDCLKTAVGFSNSLPVGDPGIIFVGLGNDGTVQDHLNLESLQKDVSRELGKIYPPIYTQMKVMRNEGGKILGSDCAWQ